MNINKIMEIFRKKPGPETEEPDHRPRVHNTWGEIYEKDI